MSILYHQTDAETAEVILRTQHMKPGSSGLAGGGIYFATTPELTGHKAQRKGVILEATVALGKILTLDADGDRTMTLQKLKSMGFGSVCIARAVSSGQEYVVYDPGQVLRIDREDGQRPPAPEIRLAVHAGAWITGAPPRSNADALAPANLDVELLPDDRLPQAVLPLSQLLNGRWNAVPGTGRDVQKLYWVDMAVPVGSTGYNAGLRTGDRFVASRGGGGMEWGPQVWERRDGQQCAGSNGIFPSDGGSYSIVGPRFAASLRAGATIFVVRDGRALRLDLPAGGDALGVSWTMPPKSAFYS
jgi:hypothetical protein